MNTTKNMRTLATQIGQRGSRQTDTSLANAWLSLGEYLKELCSALDTIHDEVHRIREELEKARLAKQP